MTTAVVDDAEVLEGGARLVPWAPDDHVLMVKDGMTMTDLYPALRELAMRRLYVSAEIIGDGDYAILGDDGLPEVPAGWTGRLVMPYERVMDDDLIVLAPAPLWMAPIVD